MKLILDDKMDISQMYTSINWSGAKEQVARELSLGIISSTTDKNIQVVDVKLNSDLKLYTDTGVEIFRGRVWSRDKSSPSNVVELVAFDDLILTNKNTGTFNFMGQTPENITKQVCKSINLPVGTLEKGSPLDRIFDEETIYNMIMTAYTIQYRKDNKPYMVMMDKGRLNVVKKGVIVAKYVLDGNTNLFEASYSESMEETVTKVRMLDENGKFIGELTSKNPGGVTKTYRQGSGENPKEMAKELLKGLEQSANVRVEGNGNFDLITGNAVTVKEPHTGLEGLFYIDGDTHTFEGGRHVVELELAFQNMMHIVESGKEKEDEQSDGEGGGISNAANDGTTQGKVWTKLRQAGYSEQATAGAMGNIEQESGFRHTVVNSIGAYGLCQWYKGRRTALQNFAKSRGTKESDLDTQIDYLLKELPSSHWMNKSGYLTRTQFKTATSIQKATESFCWCFERPGKSEANMTRRLNAANKYYNKYRNSGTSSSSSSSASGKRQAFINAATSKNGAKYSQAKRMQSGYYDCSSLIIRSMREVGLDPTGKNMTTRTIAGDSRFSSISKSQLKAGDILWKSGHVAIFMGGNKTFEAMNPRKGVGYSTGLNRFTKYYRIKGID